MSFKELFKKYKIYTIVGIIVLLMLVVGGTTAGVLLTKQDKEQINNSANAAVGSTFILNNLRYRVLTEGTTNTVEIYDTTSTSISGAIEIPSQVSNDGITYTVTSIGENAFYGCSSLTSITIPDSVTSIGSDAFYNCTSLTSITIPDSVTSIGSDAFHNCTSLTSITIPDSVTEMGSSAFNGCSSLISVTIGKGITSIGERAFYGCSGLTEITISDSVTSIGDSAFYSCSGLQSITLGNNVTFIEDRAFSGCTSLTEINFNATNMSDLVSSSNVFSSAGEDGTGIIVNIGANVTKIPAYVFADVSSLKTVNFLSNSQCKSIGSNAFYRCNNLTSCIIPDSVTSIGSWAFSGCSSLTEVIIPDGVTNIENYTFSGCDSLVEIIIPDNVTNIGESAFSGDSLMEFSVSANNANYMSVDGILFNKTQTVLIRYPKGKTGNNYIIPSSVTSIGDSAFYDCRNLTGIVIPNSVTSIGDSAFYSCSGLTSVTIPDSVISIGSSMFQYCRNLISVTIPNSVTSIAENMFWECKSLTSIDIPESVTSIGGDAFGRCYSLTEVTIPNSVTSIGDGAFQDCSGLTKVTIPDSVTSIGNSAFSACTSLTSVAIPDSVTSIGGSAFRNCTSLTDVYYAGDINDWVSIDFGNQYANPLYYADNLYLNGQTSTPYEFPSDLDLSNATKIGSYSLYNQTGITSVTIGDVVTSIGSYAFYGCSGLTEVTIPSSVTSIGSYAFRNCSNLTNVYYAGDILDWIGIDFGGGNYGNLLYNSNSNLYLNGQTSTPYVFPSNLDLSNATKIGSYSLYGQTGITSVTIGNNVTSIGSYAFYGCSGLTEVIIPNSVINIGSYAFRNCSNLTNVYYAGDINDWVSIDFGDYYANPLYYSDNLFLNGDTNTPIKSININTATTMGTYCLAGWRDLQSIIIGEQVTDIGNGAFYYCSGLTEIIIPNSITSIGSSVFYGCSGLTDVTIPSSVTSIGSGAFRSCSRLNNIYFYNDISADISSIGSYAFYAGSSAVTYWVKDQTSLINIQNMYFTRDFTTSNFKIMTVQGYVANNSTSLGTVSGGGDLSSNTLTAIPNSNAVFLGWSTTSDGSNIIPGTENQTTYTATSEGNYYAVFKKVISLTISTDSSLGQVYVNGRFVTNETIQITDDANTVQIMALSKPGSAFICWQITVGDSTTYDYDNNPLSMSITEDTTITAVFSNSLMEGIGVVADGGGQVRVGGYDLDNVDDTTQVVLNAICYSGYTFDGWYTMENGVLTKIEALGNFTAVTINVADYDGKLIIARFIPNSNGNVNEDLNNS